MRAFDLVTAMLLSAVTTGCARSPATNRSEIAAAPPPAEGLEPARAPRGPPLPTSSQVHAPAAPLPRAVPPQPAPDAVSLRRELAVPVLTLAIDRPPHLALVSTDSVWIHDARGWRSETPPKIESQGASFAAVDEQALFYGRDYRVRWVATRGGAAAAENFYFRWLPGGFRSARDEIGRLAKAKAGRLLTVLGTADPEVVCVPGDICIIKRLSGWTQVAAPLGLDAVAIHDGNAFALAEGQLLRLEGVQWKAAAPPQRFTSATTLWVTGEAAWVIETSVTGVHHFDGTAWRLLPSPVGTPTALWGLRAEGLWLAGHTGLARFDGRAFRRASSTTERFDAVLGRSETDVWAGGPAGLFHLE